MINRTGIEPDGHSKLTTSNYRFIIDYVELTFHN